VAQMNSCNEYGQRHLWIPVPVLPSKNLLCLCGSRFHTSSTQLILFLRPASPLYLKFPIPLVLRGILFPFSSSCDFLVHSNLQTTTQHTTMFPLQRLTSITALRATQRNSLMESGSLSPCRSPIAETASVSPFSPPNEEKEPQKPRNVNSLMVLKTANGSDASEALNMVEHVLELSPGTDSLSVDSSLSVEVEHHPGLIHTPSISPRSTTSKSDEDVENALRRKSREERLCVPVERHPSFTHSCPRITNSKSMSMLNHHDPSSNLLMPLAKRPSTHHLHTTHRSSSQRLQLSLSNTSLPDSHILSSRASSSMSLDNLWDDECASLSKRQNGGLSGIISGNSTWHRAQNCINAAERLWNLVWSLRAMVVVPTTCLILLTLIVVMLTLLLVSDGNRSFSVVLSIVDGSVAHILWIVLIFISSFLVACFQICAMFLIYWACVRYPIIRTERFLRQLSRMEQQCPEQCGSQSKSSGPSQMQTLLASEGKSLSRELKILKTRHNYMQSFLNRSAVQHVLCTSPVARQMKRKRLSVLLIEVVDFHSSLSPYSRFQESSLGSFLDSVIETMVPCVERNEGIVNTVMGHGTIGLQCIFGLELGDERSSEVSQHQSHSLQACSALLEVHKECQLMRAAFAVKVKDSSHIFSQFQIRMSVSNGMCLWGAVGNPLSRMAFACMGEPMSIAVRLQNIAFKWYGVQNLICCSTFEKVKHRFYARFIDFVQINESDPPLYCFEILGRREQQGTDESTPPENIHATDDATIPEQPESEARVTCLSMEDLSIELHDAFLNADSFDDIPSIIQACKKFTSMYKALGIPCFNCERICDRMTQLLASKDENDTDISVFPEHFTQNMLAFQVPY